MSERFTFTVDTNNELKIWDANFPLPEDAPVIIQPSWPNGDEWSKEEAESWATAWIGAALDLNSEFIPGYSSEVPVISRPQSEENTL